MHMPGQKAFRLPLCALLTEPQIGATHLQLEWGVVHHDDLGEDAGSQRGPVIFIKSLVHILMQERGLSHAGVEGEMHTETCVSLMICASWSGVQGKYSYTSPALPTPYCC